MKTFEYDILFFQVKKQKDYDAMRSALNERARDCWYEGGIRMMRAVAIGSLLVVLGANAGVAERNLIPTLDNEPDVCPDQPPEPQWMKDIDVRESHKRLLFQQIYRAQSMQRIVEAQSCECPTRCI